MADRIKIGEIDAKILRILLSESRTSFTAIAVECKITVTAVRMRYKRLWKEGVINGEKMLVNPHCLGYRHIVDLGIINAAEDEKEVAKFLESKPYISELVSPLGKFNFDGKGDDLMGSFVLAVILLIPTLFISMIWYTYKRTKYIWDHTTFGNARFHSGITFGGYFWLHFVNLLLLICTIGFGMPWAKVRTMRYYLENLTLEGHVDLNAVVQDAQEASAFGEEIGDFLDMDFDMG